MRDEKRQLSAILLRRLEVEEWDKERMRHFYYGLYGLGPWCAAGEWADGQPDAMCLRWSLPIDSSTCCLLRTPQAANATRTFQYAIDYMTTRKLPSFAMI